HHLPVDRKQGPRHRTDPCLYLADEPGHLFVHPALEAPAPFETPLDSWIAPADKRGDARGCCGTRADELPKAEIVTPLLDNKIVCNRVDGRVAGAHGLLSKLLHLGLCDVTAAQVVRPLRDGERHLAVERRLHHANIVPRGLAIRVMAEVGLI